MTASEIQTLINAAKSSEADLVTWTELRAILEGLKNQEGAEGDYTLDMLGDVDIDGFLDDTQVLRWNGTAWVNEVLTTDDIAEGNNLFFTLSRSRNAISGGTGISYNPATGEITSTITQYTSAMARAAISLTTTGSGAATYNSSTGVLNIPTPSSVNIYNADGTLAGSRTVAMGGNTLSFVSNNNGAARLNIQQQATGTAALARLDLLNNANENISMGKYSTATSSYKILTASDGYLYTSSGDIALLSDAATSRIKFAAGGSSTAQMTIFPNGRVGINNTTDAGYQFDVNGTTVLRNTTTLFAGATLVLNDVTNTQTGRLIHNSTPYRGTQFSFQWNGSNVFGYNAGGMNFLHSSTNNDYLFINRAVFSGGATGGNGFTFEDGGSFAPTTGTNTYNVLRVRTVYNSTGGTNTITGFSYDPILTSMTGVTHRAIHTVTGDVLLGTTSGNVGVGTTSPTEKLDVNGTMRVQIGGLNALSVTATSNVYGTTGTQVSTSTFHTFRALSSTAGGEIALQSNNSTTQSPGLSFYTSNGDRQARLIGENGALFIGVRQPSGTMTANMAVYAAANRTSSQLGISSVGGDYTDNTAAVFRGHWTGASALTLKAFSASSTVPTFRVRTIADDGDALSVTSANNVLVKTSTDAGFGLDVNGTARVQSEMIVNGSTVGRGAGNQVLNNAFGLEALRVNTSGTYNIGIGYQSLYANTTGTRNVGVGVFSLYSVNTITDNTAIGSEALQYLNTENGATAIGSQAARFVTQGQNGVAIGYRAGHFIQDGTTNNNNLSNSIFIGGNTRGFGTTGNSNQIVIGAGATGLGGNTMVLGNSSIVTTHIAGNVGIGITNPSHKLHVVGNASISDDFFAAIGTGKRATFGATGDNDYRVSIDGDLRVYGKIRTGAPDGGSGPGIWKLGSSATGTFTLNTSQCLEVELNGTLYRIATLNLA